MCHPASMQIFSYMYKIYTQLTVPSWYLVHVARTFPWECCFGNLSCNSIKAIWYVVLWDITGNTWEAIGMSLERPLESFPSIARVLKS